MDTATATLSDHDEVQLARAMATMECPPYLLPGEKSPSRLVRAAMLIRNGGVLPTGACLWNVAGSHGIAYHCEPAGCSCEASTKGKSKWCYHLVACALWDRWQSMVHTDYVSAFDTKKGNEMSAVPVLTEDFLAMDEQGGAPASSTTEDDAGAPQPWRDWTPPSPPSHRPLAAIIHDLSRPLPDACVAHRKQDGQDIAYLHWWDVRLLLDTYAPGWTGNIVRVEEYTREEIANKRSGELAQKHTAVVTYRLTIPCAEGLVSREAIGRESAESVPFGDWTSNASAMAFTRAAAMFGVGVWLRERKEDGRALSTSEALRQHLLKEEWARLAHGKNESERQEIQARLLQSAGVTQRKEVPLWMLRAVM